MAAQSGKKKILIALQKPTVVLGNADPLDTINRYLTRSYAIGPVRGRWVTAGVVASCVAGYALYAGFSAMFAVIPKTLSPEWIAAREEYNRAYGTSFYRAAHNHEIGQPVAAIPKPSKRITGDN